jgi:hypothetical protein
MNWIQRLQTRWKLKSSLQVVMVLIVFSCTGFTVVYIKKPTLYYFFGDNIPWLAKLLYYVFIMPVYNVILLFYAFVFRQFQFFWEFEKRFLNRIFSIFKPKK